MNFKKTIFSSSKTLTSIIAMAGLLQGGCFSSSQSKIYSPKVLFQKCPSFSMADLTVTEKQQFLTLIKDFSEHSLSAKKLLNELANQNARLKLYTRQANEKGIFRAGESNENFLGLNRLIKEKGVSLEDTFFHEAEHVVHLKRAHRKGINARSFSSLNDVYIYATLLEALAYRKAFICCAEREGKLSAQEIQKKAQKVFEERFLTKSKNKAERRSYEDDAIRMANSDAKLLPNQIYFGKKPNWNEIVSILSREEVTSVSVLPQPTLTFFAVCLLREIEKHPDAEGLEDLDISCVLTNKSALQKDQKEIKEIISSHLMEVYDIFVSKGNILPQKTRDSFLYLIGWPNAQQQAKINQEETLPRKKAMFKKMYEFNLKGFDTSSMFDSAIELLSKKEIVNYNIPEVKKFKKILTFEKMILISPASQQKTMIKEKVR